MSTAELKGCHAIQNLGAVETYVRRYLYFAAYEIVEAEALDRTQNKPDEEKPAKKKKQTPREELIAKLNEKGIDIKAFAKEKGLTPKTTDERYNELLKELEEKENV